MERALGSYAKKASGYKAKGRI